MHEQEWDPHFIESILDLLHLLQENQIDLEAFLAGSEQTEFLSALDLEQHKTAVQLMQFMDEMPGGFLIYYADGDEQIIFANRAVLRIFQCYTMSEFRELTHNSFQGFVHPEDLAAVQESIQTQIASSQYDLDYVEYRIVCKDGTIRWIEDYGHFVHREPFRNVFYVFLGDATERRDRQLAENAVLLDEKRKEEQKLQDLIRAYDKERASINREYLRRLEVIEGLSINYESILYVDLDADQLLPYRSSSRGGLIFGDALQMCSFSQSMFEYTAFWVHSEDRALFSRAISPDHIREKLENTKTYYTNYRVLDGEEVQYLQLRVVNVGHQELVSQVVIGFRRVDEELQQEMEQKQLLAEALDNATRAIGAKNTFLSNMSHDMRTPLNAIFGFTTLAKRSSQNPDAVYSYLERIENSSRQLLDLISKVLDLSQTESSEAHLDEVECDLCETIQEIYDFLLPQAIEKDIDFSLDCTKITHKKIFGDQEKFKQLILYLANNAVTYTKPGGKVSITAVEQEELPNQYILYQLMVKDTGIGINQNSLERIFEPFVREKNTTLSGIHGIGLGLTITKNLVDIMGGTIDVKSQVGKGSIFTISLHFRRALESSAGINHVDVPSVRESNQSILLVEDNEINLEIETELLEEMGFSIDTAVNGSIAVEKVKNAVPGQYDLILMDIQMPVMDGWQAAQAIRKLPNTALAHIPIIALSANVFESDMRRSVECGMDAHLPKPLDILLLLNTIETITKRHSAPSSLL